MSKFRSPVLSGKSGNGVASRGIVFWSRLAVEWFYSLSRSFIHSAKSFKVFMNLLRSVLRLGIAQTSFGSAEAPLSRPCPSVEPA